MTNQPKSERGGVMLSTEATRACIAFAATPSILSDATGTAERAHAELTALLNEVERLREACFEVYLHGNYRFLTEKMRTEVKDAFADAINSHSSDGALAERWWKHNSMGGEPSETGRKHERVVHVNCTKDNCNICDGGLFVCKHCGRAEIELDEPCVPRPTPPNTLSVGAVVITQGQGAPAAASLPSWTKNPVSSGESEPLGTCHTFRTMPHSKDYPINYQIHVCINWKPLPAREWERSENE